MEPVKHIHKEGARYHVLDWTLLEGPGGMVQISRCSEPLCEYNFFAAEVIEGVGLDPARYVPAVVSRPTPGSKEKS